MYLSRPAEYALRAAAYLARKGTAKRTRTADLASAIDAPAPYLSKIMQRLTAAGILSSKKGHYGGFVLAKPPAEVRFIDILRAVDFEPASDHCLFGWESCGWDNPCPLHAEWVVLKQEIERWARAHTLADGLKQRALLRHDDATRSHLATRGKD